MENLKTKLLNRFDGVKNTITSIESDKDSLIIAEFAALLIADKACNEVRNRLLKPVAESHGIRLTASLGIDTATNGLVQSTKHY